MLTIVADSSRGGELVRRLLVALTVIGGALLLSLPRQLQDLDVYRAGGLALLHGRDPYGVASGPAHLPFTYPPFATVLAAPLGALPRWFGACLLFAGDAGALGLLHRWLRPRIDEARMGAKGAAAQRIWGLAADPTSFVCGSLLLFEPARSSAAYGQVNLLLLGLIVVDLTGPPTRRTGIITGLAAAVKLTPLVFLGWLVVTRQLAAAIRAAATFALAGLLAFAIAPSASRDYWEHYAGDARRVGTASYGSNQALSGLIGRVERVTAPHGAGLTAITIVIGLAGLAIAAGWAGADRDLSLCLAALTGLVVSPISWSHHWVWLIPAGVLLLTRRDRVLRAGGGLLLGVAILGAPSWWERGGTREFHRGWLDYVLGETYLFAALLVLLVAGSRVIRRPSVSTGAVASPRPRTGRRAPSGGSSTRTA